MSKKLISFVNYINIIQWNGSVLKIYDSLNTSFIINRIHYKFFIKPSLENLLYIDSTFFFYENIISGFSFFNNFYEYLLLKINNKKKLWTNFKNVDFFLQNKFLNFHFIFKDLLKYNNYFILDIIKNYKKNIISNIFFNI